MSFALCWKLEPPQPHRETAERIAPTADEMKDAKNFEKFYLFVMKLYHKKYDVSMKLNFSSIFI